MALQHPLKTLLCAGCGCAVLSAVGFLAHRTDAQPPDAADASAAGARTYVVVTPGIHPGTLFSEQELPLLRRRARQGLTPLAAEGSLWLPAAVSEVWADGRRVRAQIAKDRVVRFESAAEN